MSIETESVFYNGDISSPSIFHVPKGRKTLPPIFQKGDEYSLLCLWRDEDISLPSFWKARGGFSIISFGYLYSSILFCLKSLIFPIVVSFSIFFPLSSRFLLLWILLDSFQVQWGTFFSSFLSSLFFLGIHSIFLFIFCHFSSRYPQEENLTVNGLFQSTPLLELFPLRCSGTSVIVLCLKKQLKIYHDCR